MNEAALRSPTHTEAATKQVAPATLLDSITRGSSPYMTQNASSCARQESMP
jgi:hypothetical protein